MKRLLCCLIVLGVVCSSYAFDRSLNGSWGIVNRDSEKFEVIRFSTNEIILEDTLFRANDYEEVNDYTIYFSSTNNSNSFSAIQFHLLTPNKMLLIMIDDYNDRIYTLILSRM
jgi:outer membrane lipoprotein-sorting protein